MGRTESKHIPSHADYISAPGSAAIQRCLPRNPSNAQWATAEQGSTLQTAAHHLHPHRATLIKISCLHGLPCGVYTDCLLLLLTKDFLRGYHHPKEKLLADLHVFYMRSSSQQEYLSDSSRFIKKTCTRAHSWRLLLTQNQVSTLKLKGKLEGLKFSCLFFRRRKHLGLGNWGMRKIEEPAFVAIKEKKNWQIIFLYTFLSKTSGALAHPLTAACSPAAVHALMERMKPVLPQPEPSVPVFSRDGTWNETWSFRCPRWRGASSLPSSLKAQTCQLHKTEDSVNQPVWLWVFSCSSFHVLPHLYHRVNTRLLLKLKKALWL